MSAVPARQQIEVVAVVQHPYDVPAHRHRDARRR